MVPSSLLTPFPRYLYLSADARFTQTNYVDDQTWELKTQKDPPSLALSSSYGLRATSMSVFPGFQWQGHSRVDPRQFVVPPQLLQALPNYFKVRCQPFDLLAAELEWWAVESDVILGRISLMNLDLNSGDHRLSLYAMLRPAQGGEPMGEHEIDGVSLLLGRAQKLRPLLFMSGGARPEQAAHPALAVTHRLMPHESTRVLWALVSKTEPQVGFSSARSWAGIDWEPSLARVERAHDGWVKIECGDPKWSASLHAAQQAGLQAVLSGSRGLPHHSFVGRRTPDDGFSGANDGKDHPLPWSGQDGFACDHLGRQIMWAAPDLVRGFLLNYLETSGARGEIDSRPGLAGQRGGSLCPPLLASLAWELHSVKPSREFLSRIYDPLKRHIHAWFSPAQDRDRDGAPEWDNVIQSGNPDSPTFVPWAQWGQGLDISTVEPPDLMTYLLLEIQSLIEIADVLGASEDRAELETRSAGLRQAILRAWDEKSGRFLFLDRDTHHSGEGKTLGRRKGSFVLKVGKKFDPEVRLVVGIDGPEREGHEASVTIHGRGPKGQFRTEKLAGRQLRWFLDVGRGTSSHTFASIEKVVAAGFSKRFRIQIGTADHRRPEVTQFVPLLSRVVRTEQSSKAIEDNFLRGDFWRAGGIPSLSPSDPAYDPDDRPEASGVRMRENALLGRALLAQGRRAEAADLVGRLLTGASKSLEMRGAFSSHYHPESGDGMAELGSILGLAPLDLFLEVLGVKLRHGPSVELQGMNPYPWPVTIHWRGMSVTRPLNGPTIVRFASGGEAEVAEGDAARVSPAAGGEAGN